MNKSYWLNSDGALIDVSKTGHEVYAIKYLQDNITNTKLYYFFREKVGLVTSTDILHELGWVRIQINDYYPWIKILGSCADLTKPVKNTIQPSMNEKQMKVAKELCIKHNTEFHVAINDKRFW